MAWTCHAVILSLVQQDSIFLPQLRSVHLVIQYRVHPGFVEAESRISEPHVVDVHVGGADSELADVSSSGYLSNLMGQRNVTWAN